MTPTSNRANGDWVLVYRSILLNKGSQYSIPGPEDK